VFLRDFVTFEHHNLTQKSGYADDPVDTLHIDDRRNPARPEEYAAGGLRKSRWTAFHFRSRERQENKVTKDPENMQKRNLLSAAIALIALSFTLCLQTASKADSFSLAQAGGSFNTAGSYQATHFDVYAYSMYLSAYNMGMSGGSLSVHNDMMWVNADVASVTTTPTRAVVTSAPFTYYDYALWQVYQAQIVVTLNTNGSMGGGGYKIVRTDNGQITHQTGSGGIDIGSGYSEFAFTDVPVSIWQF